MALPGVLSDYIVRNYKRLLICVVPPPPPSDTDAGDVPPVQDDVLDGSSRASQRPSAAASLSVSDQQQRHGNRNNTRDRDAPRPLDARHHDAALDDLRRDGFAEPHHASSDSLSRWRRRRSAPRARARRARRQSATFVYVHEGTELVREDPFRGCVSSRSVGPRSSGDFVVMGCMQV